MVLRGMNKEEKNTVMFQLGQSLMEIAKSAVIIDRKLYDCLAVLAISIMQEPKHRGRLLKEIHEFMDTIGKREKERIEKRAKKRDPRRNGDGDTAE